MGGKAVWQFIVEFHMLSMTYLHPAGAFMSAVYVTVAVLVYPSMNRLIHWTVKILQQHWQGGGHRHRDAHLQMQDQHPVFPVPLNYQCLNRGNWCQISEVHMPQIVFWSWVSDGYVSIRIGAAQGSSKWREVQVQEHKTSCPLRLYTIWIIPIMLCRRLLWIFVPRCV